MSAPAPQLGAVTRARKSVDAIRALATMRGQGRTNPTPDERAALEGFSGWGSLKELFAPTSQTWLDLSTEVQSLIPATDFKIGNLSTYSSFYTPQWLAEAMWKLLADLGFTGGTVLEPGCGGGIFFGTAPAGVRMVGVDRDPTAAAIVQALYPGHKVITSPLERATLPGQYTAVIGNVPFGDVPVFDPTAPPGVSQSLHNYMIWRAVSELAPGGVAVLLTSRYTMDNTAEYARAEIGEIAEFVGAIRLPNGALGGGTTALADVVVLRRKGADTATGDAWLDTRAFTTGTSVNTYWDVNPGLVLGDMKPGQTTRFGLGVTVGGDLAALPGRFDSAAAVLSDRAAGWGTVCAEPIDPTALDVGAEYTGGDPWYDGQFRWVDGRLLQMKPAKRATKTSPAKPRRTEVIARPSDELKRLLKLRDVAKTLVELEADHDLPDTAPQLVDTRAEALRLYKAYVAAYGAINRSQIVEDKPADLPVPRGETDPARAAVAAALAAVGDDFGLTDRGDDEPVEYKLVAPRLGGFRADPDFQLVAALEVYDDDTGEHEPAPILTVRQNRRVERPTKTSDPGQALAWSLDRHGGKVDVGFIADTLGVSRLEVPGLLGDRVYLDPSSMAWTTAEEYRSGNVRDKLRWAKVAAADNPDLARNVTALEAVLPAWLGAHQIKVQLGMPWIPVADVKRFIVDVLEDGDRYSTVKVKQLTGLNQWEVKHGRRGSNTATIQWGTPDRNAYALIEDGLNQRVPVVEVPRKGDDGEIRMVKDPDKSILAVAKLKDLQDKFADWLWEDPDRRWRLVEYYNETYNALVPRIFDGSHITIDGLAPWFAAKVYRHQLEFVARAVASGASLCGHPVGAGKTATMAMTIMKLKQLGLIRKGMIAVPKHLLEQTARQVRQLFPAARVLAVSSESIGANRREFAARCATQDWDVVIITHPAFDKLRVWEGTEAAYHAEQQETLSAAIHRACPNGILEPGMVKRAAKAADRLTKKINDLQHRAVARDTGVITFEMLGIDFVCIDEAHYYKNLALPCRAEGFTVKEAKRATDLAMKLWWLKQRRGGAPYAALFTGTPVSNTMLELYVVLHYTMQDYLKSIGLGTADVWAAAFVQMVTTVDVSVDGGRFSLKTRPGLFLNAPELRLLLSMCADIRTAEQLGLARPGVDERVIAVAPTAAQEAYSADLVVRAEDAKGQGRRVEKGADNMLKICTDGRRMATDPKLVGIDDDEPGKLAAAAEQILAVWAEYPDELQIVFCDLGTPSAKRGDQTYGRLRDLLVAGGMPAARIEFIHSYSTGQAKAGLFARCRSGKVSVIMGSTDKLGVGTNIQTRVVAMHHIDAPFRPADIEQRDGRGRRPGNRHAVVKVFRYVTQKTFDAYMWQLLTRKAGFITQILSGQLDRTIDDVTSDVVLSYAAIKASATGQPLLEEQATLQVRFNSLEVEQRAWRMARADLAYQLERAPDQAKAIKDRIALWQRITDSYTGKLTEEDVKVLKAYAADQFAWRPVTVAGVRVNRSKWRDLKNDDQPLLLVGGTGAADGVKRRLMRFHKPDDWLKEFEEIVRSAAWEAGQARSDLARHHDKVAKDRQLADVPFAKQGEYDTVRARLDQIDLELREAAAPPPQDIKATDEDIERAAEADRIRAAAAAANDDAGQADDIDGDAAPVISVSDLFQLVNDLFTDPAVSGQVNTEVQRALAALDQL